MTTLYVVAEVKDENSFYLKNGHTYVHDDCESAKADLQRLLEMSYEVTKVDGGVLGETETVCPGSGMAVYEIEVGRVRRVDDAD